MEQSSAVPFIDLSHPDSKSRLVKACEDFGFFKVVNHGIPIEFMADLESEALNFFSLPLTDKQKAGPPDPFGYGSKKIGCNGDVGWLEYLMLTTDHHKCTPVLGDRFRRAVNDYLTAVKRMACQILETLADGLKIQARDVFSKLLMDEQSDSVFRINRYPPSDGGDLIGFGEHTDPQIISVLRSNDSRGLEISLRDGEWISIPPDQHSFFINVGDSLQVMTNGRFKSVRHRVMTKSPKPRLSMIYFGGPPLSEKIAPLASLMKEGDSLYKEFTWFDFKKSVYNSRLSDNRLGPFENNNIAASS